MTKYIKCDLQVVGDAHRKVWAMQEAAGWPLSRLSLTGSDVVSTWANDPVGEALLVLVMQTDYPTCEIGEEQQVHTFLEQYFC